MRIHAKPVGNRLLALVILDLSSINLLVSSPEIIFFPCFLLLETFRVMERVPAPITHRSQWHTFGISLWEGLQACSVNGDGKATITHTER